MVFFLSLPYPLAHQISNPDHIYLPTIASRVPLATLASVNHTASAVTPTNSSLCNFKSVEFFATSRIPSSSIRIGPGATAGSKTNMVVSTFKPNFVFFSIIADSKFQPVDCCLGLKS